MSEESQKSKPKMIGLISDDYDGYDLNISSKILNENHFSFVLLIFWFGELKVWIAITSQPSATTPKFKIFRTSMPVFGAFDLSLRRSNQKFLHRMCVFLLTTIRMYSNKNSEASENITILCDEKVPFFRSRSDVYPKSRPKIYKNFGPRSVKARSFTVLVLLIIRKTSADVSASSSGCARTCFWKCSGGAIVVG